MTGVRGRETIVCQLGVFLSHQVEDRLCKELQEDKWKVFNVLLTILAAS